MFIVFDVNGTLTDPSALGEPWGRPDLGPGILRDAIGTAMIDTILGRFRPLSEHVRGALETTAGRHGLDPAGVEAAVERASHLPPWPDASDALDVLRDAGWRIAALTNSGSVAGRATLEAAGLADRFDAILGVEEVRAFKPDPRVYRYAVDRLGIAPDEAVLVAAHAFDVDGAADAGLGTAWVARGETVLGPMGAAPDHRADDLAGIAEVLAGRLRAAG
ncbi:haloacid dehalogenase type II [Patulibacter minatonensis]|uniref:haloacid dehalogenase type II n=1 Tax=Patulibacter minatonensis TaxID=298163 RepID=UPI0004B50B45|nr:haloacid dehalogenase type II [Patulibacter minatonensis]